MEGKKLRGSSDSNQENVPAAFGSNPRLREGTHAGSGAHGSKNRPNRSVSRVLRLSDLAKPIITIDAAGRRGRWPCSLPLDVTPFTRCVGNHRGIVNACHWSLNVKYNEEGLSPENDNEPRTWHGSCDSPCHCSSNIQATGALS
jgi:hypothetical protein